MSKKFSPQLALISLVLLISVIGVSAGCSSSPSATFAGAPATSSTGNPSDSATSREVTINLTAQNMAFDMNTMTVAAGAKVTINFNNKDGGIPHNFAVYTDSSATTTIFKGQTISGPATAIYAFTAPNAAGTYFFRCDVHPTTMIGKFVVQ